ncbi:spore protease YyaC [Peribacillus alkalitolerans]|uniref:spore protease YyaC n=1 Tax=Peribacillus alkalitolerans TaxID=1550385 RepID=UPI0013D27DC9|nr:spore protease YyaC [Peribacillus alkalitolerans]
MNFNPGFLDNSRDKTSRIIFEEQDAVKRISEDLLSLFPVSRIQNVVIVCIGTDRSTGDSLGPLVGTFLSEKSPTFHVYGTLEDPIHAVNLEEKLAHIKMNHHNPFIIGVDACLGRLKNVGTVQIGEGPVKPGAGVNKELPPVGDAHITGIVNVSGFMEFFVLQNTRLNLVLKMARTIADGIHLANKRYKPTNTFSKFSWGFDQEQASQ